MDLKIFNLIMSLTGISSTAASVVLRWIDVASALSVLLFLTGIGAAAGAAIWSYRIAIGALKKTNKNAAIQL
ncbi:hypothetical protein CAI16_15680 [Virgibacillus dokdonensis]|uniref:Uncharacterized protein n=1 Tax=Virgibacillus dokdonensis TaxID=302167 RepID=A0A3E0WMD7_9BACI|nr:hypothetical protein [Virgibacillus dokdonensis]RFA33136.1 hypothetical protein CAI16_15680 [Virgibacillus dokdonensis]